MTKSLPLPAGSADAGDAVPSPRWSTRIADAVFGYDFFISYSQADGYVLPRALKAALEARGFRVFLDQTDYVAGIDLRSETGRQVRKSRKLVIVARPAALKSEWVLREVTVALEAGRLPVVININGAVQSAETESQLGVMIRDRHWLRVDEEVPGADLPVSVRVIDELARGFSHTRQEEKRRRIVLCAILVLAVAAGLATWMAVVAEQQRATAVRNFEIANKAADALVIDIARGLRDVEGIRIESVEKILGRAQQAYEALATGVGDDPRILRSRVAMYNEFVETYLAKGDTERAAKAAAASVDAARRLKASTKDDRAAARSLGLALLKAGDTFAELGSFDQAKGAYEEARQLRERLAADQEDLVAKRELGVALVRLGDLASRRLDWPEARRHLEQALAMREELEQVKPAWRRDVALTHILLVDVALAEKRNEAARTHAMAAQTRFATLQGEDLGSTKALRDLAVADQRRGNVEMTDRRFDAAREAFSRSRAHFLALRKKDPANIEWERDVLATDGKFVELAEAEGQGNPAMDLATRLVAEREQLLARSPDSSILRQDLEEARDMLARIRKRASSSG